MSDISLAEMLQVGRKPQKPIQLSLLRLAAAQLDQAHQARLVHGNLTPHSIIVSQSTNGEPVAVRISDFGTKFNLDPGTKTGRIPDEAFYLSPEQILGIDVTPASDEFSFGVIAYEMVSGRRPFDAASVSGLIFAICTDEPVPVHEIDNSLTPGVSGVLSRALAKDREQRYLSCGQFVAALEGELVRCEGWADAPVAAAYFERPAPFAEQARALRSPAEPLAPVASTASAVFTDPSATQLFAAPPSVAGVPSRTAAASEPLPASPPPPPPRPAAPFPAPHVTSPFSAPPLSAPRQDVPFESIVRPETEYPPVRRRQRYGDEEIIRPRESPVARFAVIAAVLILLGSAAFYYLNRPAKPDLPTQVLDTKNAPVAPPPGNNSEPQSTSAAPNPSSTEPSPQAQVKPAPQAPAPVPPQDAQAQARNSAPVAAPPAAQDTLGAKTTRPRQPERAQSPGAQAVPEERGSTAISVELLSEPPGATITVDNNPRLVCRAPCTLSLGEGRHTLAAQLAGYTIAQRIFNVPESSSIFVAMPKLTGALVVTSNPAAATILVDGKDYGMTPATLHLPPGQHRVTLMNGSQRHDETVDVVADGIQATGYTFPR